MMDRLPYTSSYPDRHGKRRWRFRRRGRAQELPGAPGDPEFAAAYAQCLANFPEAPKAAEVHRLPNAIVPRSLRACWIVVQRSAEWKRMTEGSRANQARVAERFLTRTVFKGDALTWGEVPVAEIRRKHVKDILGEMADTPHAAEHVLRCIRKLMLAALDEEWIEVDPTYRVKWSPPIEGHRAWTAAERARFEAHWPTGSTPRLVYALALCTGLRRKDLVRVEWRHIVDGVIIYKHAKTGQQVDLEILGPLADEIAVTPRRGATIIVTAYGQPFSEKSITGRFRDWTEAAGLSGCTLHGCRHTLGGEIAENGGTTKQIQAALGHTTLQQAERYSKSAERKRNAADGLKLVRFGRAKSG